MLNEEMTQKLLQNEAIHEFKKSEYTAWEKALILKELLEREKQKPKVPGQTPSDRVAAKIGITRKHFYRIMMILKANDNTLKKIQKGQLSDSVATAVLYNLKDKDKEDEAMDKAIKEGYDVHKSRKLAWRINEPGRLIMQINAEIGHFRKNMDSYLDDIRSLEIKQKLAIINALESHLRYIQMIQQKVRDDK